MARFQFRLAPVLRFRERIEEEKKQLLAAAQRTLAQAEARRQALRDRREALARELVSRHRKLDAETLRLTYAHLDFLAREINSADWEVHNCVKAVDAARDVLVRATKDRKILDRLRDRKKTAFEREEARIENHQLDDANSRYYARTHHGVPS